MVEIVSLAVLRGREQELTLLAQRLAEVAAGQGSSVLVEGRPGLGKTGLLDDVVARATRDHMRTGFGAGAASDQALPMAPLSAVLFGGETPLAGPDDAQALARSGSQRFWLIQDYGALLERAALAGPVVVALDDMQWADSATLAALRTLPLRLASLPILWVVAHRAGRQRREVRAVLETFERRGADVMRLEPLNETAVAQVVADLAGAAPDAALLQLAARAQGSPFYLVDLLRGLRDERLLHVEGGVAGLHGAQLPTRLTDGMRERLAAHSPAARHLAATASVLGKSFTFEQLAMMLDAPAATLLAPVEELLTGDLLAEAGDALTFRHDLVREAVRGTLPASAVGPLRRQAVDAMLACGASPVQVALQLADTARAGDLVAIGTLRQAATSLAGSDPATAADLTRRALELTPDGAPVRAALVAETALRLHGAGRSAEAKAFADRELREALTPDEEGEVRLSIASMIGLSPDIRADAGRRALALARLSGPLRARHFAGLVHNQVMAGRPDEARALLPAARAAVAAGGDVLAGFALALAEGGLAYADAGYRQALERITAAARDPAAEQEPGRLLLARQWRTEVLAVLDRYEENLQLTFEGQAQAQRDRQEMGVRLWGMGRGRALLQTGRLADGAAVLEGVLDAAEEGTIVGIIDAASVVALGRIALHTGDAVQRRRCLALARRLLDSGTPSIGRYGAWLLALDSAIVGLPGRARETPGGVVGIRALMAEQPLIVDVVDLVELTRLALSTGDREQATAVAGLAAYRERRTPEVATIAGVAAQTRGLAGGGVEDLAGAVRAFETGPRPLALASAIEDLGGWQAQAGDPAAARVLRRALALYTRTGAARDAARVRGRLRALGVRTRIVPPRPGRPGWQGLSESELAVVRLVTDGMTNRAAADHLFLSPHTVNSHLRHAFAKLGVTSRVELVRLVAEHDEPDVS